MADIDPFSNDHVSQRVVLERLHLPKNEQTPFANAVDEFRRSYQTSTRVSLSAELLYKCDDAAQRREYLDMAHAFLDEQGKGKLYWKDHDGQGNDPQRPQYSKDRKMYVIPS